MASLQPFLLYLLFSTYIFPDLIRGSQLEKEVTLKEDVLLFSCSVLSDFFAIPWTAVRQASLSFTISQSLLKLMSTDESMIPISSSVTLFFCLQSFPASGSFPMS